MISRARGNPVNGQVRADGFFVQAGKTDAQSDQSTHYFDDFVMRLEKI